MRRVLLDTSVFTEMLQESNKARLHSLLAQVIAYGSSLIRKELRDTPKSAILAGRSLRILLLNLYDSTIQGRVLATTPPVEELALQYVKFYRQRGGNCSSDEVFNDFRIIALATIHHLDIVVSNDERTMLSQAAQQAYNIVNREAGLETPALITYRKFIGRSLL